MDASYYEDYISERAVKNANSETNWDKRAASFNAAQQRGGNATSGEVTRYLRQAGLVDGKSVLDIGGGSGRYALLFAPQARDVLVTDISANMLQYARQNAAAAGLVNVRFEKLDWDAGPLDAALAGGFDLAFASMCPAARTIQGLTNMMAASRGYCAIAQYIRSYDSLESALTRASGATKRHDPHNDRDAVYGIFNWLWTNGYSPSVHYVREAGSESLSAEEAFERYRPRGDGPAAWSRQDAERVLASLSRDGRVELALESDLALLYWDTAEGRRLRP